jgi:hypothetical protein
MNPDLEIFLQDVFNEVQSSSPAIGRVVVEPDYESGSTDADPEELRRELARLLSMQHPDVPALATHPGIEVQISGVYPELAKCVRRIFLHGDKAEGPWIEVAPPGYWI